MSTNNDRLRKDLAYNFIREEVIRRDNSSCIVCGNPNELTAHHIKSQSGYPQFAMDYNNLVTLCRECHKQVHSKVHLISRPIKKRIREYMKCK